MVDEVAQMERFGGDLGIAHFPARIHRDCRETRDEKNLRMRVDLAPLPRDLDTVDSRHHDIRDQEIIGARRDGIERGQAVGNSRDLVPAALQRAGEEFTHRLVVFGEQYSRHRTRCPNAHAFRTRAGYAGTPNATPDRFRKDEENGIQASSNDIPNAPNRAYVKGDSPIAFRYMKRAMDRKTVNDSDAAIEILAPVEQRVPLVFSSPHSGRNYPDAFLAASKLDARAIRRSEDSFVDELFAQAPHHGAPLLKALFPRAYVDPNREPYELDPAMFVEKLPAFVNKRSPRVAAGLGTIARVVANGAEIYSCKLSFDEARERIERCYQPYHAALEDLIAQTRMRFGTCILIDCHSMPSIGGPMENDAGRRRQVDFILGDAHGRACNRSLTGLVEDTLREMGYTVVRNAPYSGGFITRNYGRPEIGVHALQIETNRALYMDEATIERTGGLATVAENMSRLAARLAELETAALAA